MAGISIGGIIVIVGIVLMIIWSFWIGLIVAGVGPPRVRRLRQGQVVLTV
jgi:hypothetical protein